MDNEFLPGVSNQTVLSPDTLEKLANQYGSSFYLFNKDTFVQNLNIFQAAFQKYYSNVKLGYSYKTNYMPFICQIARKEGALAEVVSGLEYELALKNGCKGNEIIFNGPLKEKNELVRAFDNGSIIHFDSYEEIKILKSYLKDNPDRTVRCALRCNFDIGEKNISRFGFDAESDEAENVYKELFALEGCSPIGIHCHFSTNHRSLKSFKIRSSKLIKLAKKIFKYRKLNYIDIGGGFFGEMPKNIKATFPYNIPSLEDYGKAVGQVIYNGFPGEKVTLILEPGASVVANTMSFICRVASVKNVKSTPVLTLTGGIHNIRPTAMGSDKRKIPFRVIKTTSKNNEISNALIGGYTCMETDIIDSSYSGNLSVGDYLTFDCVGAYNIVFKPPFIKEAPPIIMYWQEEGNTLYKLVRRRETLDDIFSSFKF